MYGQHAMRTSNEFHHDKESENLNEDPSQRAKTNNSSSFNEKYLLYKMYKYPTEI